MRTIATLVAVTIALSTFAVTVAEAQQRRTPRTLTVTPRSFFDAGKVVPVGTYSNYVTAGSGQWTPLMFGIPKYDLPLPGYFTVPQVNPFGPIDFSGQIQR